MNLTTATGKCLHFAMLCLQVIDRMSNTLVYLIFEACCPINAK